MKKETKSLLIPFIVLYHAKQKISRPISGRKKNALRRWSKIYFCRKLVQVKKELFTQKRERERKKKNIKHTILSASTFQIGHKMPPYLFTAKYILIILKSNKIILLFYVCLNKKKLLCSRRWI
jgi:hypothetical protein